MTPPETPDCNHDAMASFAAPSGSAHRLLEIGEIIWPGDESLGPDETDKWKPVKAHIIGKAVWSDWRYQSNMKFRRLKNAEKALEYPMLESGSESFSG